MKLLFKLLIIYQISLLIQTANLKNSENFENFKQALVRIKSRTEIPFIGDTDEVQISIY
jgi:hypothetical protein